MSEKTDNHSQNSKASVQPKKIKNAFIRRVRSVSPFWLLPIIATIIALTLFSQILSEQGKSITIYFENGAGIIANKTQIRYQGLQVGIVRKVNFTDDLQRIKVEANIFPEATSILHKETKFWLVHPSASLAGISGLDTLVGGNYISLRPGSGDEADEFVADSSGPITQYENGDLLIHLIADNLGSISSGASVYYKKVPVGNIYGYRFTKDHRNVEIDVVIQKKYVHLVKNNSRFWNTSGVKADLSLQGLSVNVDSLASIVQGAISFDSPPDTPMAKMGEQFKLYSDLEDAKRGIDINITLKNFTELKSGITPVYYQNEEIGRLISLDDTTPDSLNEPLVSHQLKGMLLINPAFKDIFRTNSQIIFHNNTDLSGISIKKLQQFIQGAYFEVIAGSGEMQNHYNVLTPEQLLLTTPGVLITTLTSNSSHHLNVGQGVYFDDIKVGQITKRDISIKGTTFQIAILPEYRNLINSNTKFIAASNLNVEVGVTGVSFQAATPNQWLEGGIRILKNSDENNTIEGKAKEQYPLYASVSDAEAGIVQSTLTPTITLHSNNLPNITKNSLVLYRNFPVGKILGITPTENKFNVDVFIYEKYRHLLSDKSRFWIEPATSVKVSSQGIDIQSSPLTRVLQGAISFGDINGNPPKDILYSSETLAQSYSNKITLLTSNATNISEGMDIRYKGLTVGHVTKLYLSRKSGKINIEALISPKYYSLVNRNGTEYRLVTATISSTGISNIDAAISPYIEVNGGTGKVKTTFNLLDTISNKAEYRSGLSLVLETSNAKKLTIGAPVLYRGVQVGEIKSTKLSEVGDRVYVKVIIASKYAHFVRQNTQFWISSPYSFELGLDGAKFDVGNLQQILRGGISFTTPSQHIIQPQARSNQHFLLQQKEPESLQK